MKVVHTRYGEDGDEIPVVEAIEASMKYTGYDTRGAVEEAHEIANNCANAIAIIVARMAERGLLTDNELGKMLNHNFKVARDG